MAYVNQNNDGLNWMTVHSSLVKQIIRALENEIEYDKRQPGTVIGGVVSTAGVLAFGPLGVLLGLVIGGLAYAGSGDYSHLDRLCRIYDRGEAQCKKFVERLAYGLEPGSLPSSGPSIVELWLQRSSQKVIEQTKSILGGWHLQNN